MIGETAEIGDNVTIYQCVTLGGTNPTNGVGGKRHPTLRDNVIVGSGAQIIGPITVGDARAHRRQCGGHRRRARRRDDGRPQGALDAGPAETWLKEFIPYGTPCDEPCEPSRDCVEKLESELAAMRAELAALKAALPRGAAGRARTGAHARPAQRGQARMSHPARRFHRPVSRPRRRTRSGSSAPS